MEKTTLLFKKIQFILGVVVLSVPFINTTNAQVTITKPNLIIETCSFPSAYSTLENIVITETSVSNFNAHPSSRTIILTAPTNFEFNTSPSPATTISASAGKDITGTPTITIISPTQITITYSCETNTELDVLTISGIQIRALTTASSGNITRTGGNGGINGLVNTTTLTNTLTSTLLTIPAQPSAISGNATPCLGTSQTYSVTNVAGTTYNWVFPDGWSQTAGGTTNSIIVTVGAASGNITVTPSNICGNGTTTSANQTVTVTDIVNPTISTVPVSAATNSGCTATGVVLTTPTTSDNCSVVSVTNNHPSTTYSLGNTTVTWTVTDGAGNTDTATQVVTVTDTVNPTISNVPVSATTNSGCTATGVVLTAPTTADNCSVASVTNDHPSTTYSLGNTTVTWTVTDGAGNTATANQLVTVTDTVNPTISTVPVSATTNSGCTVTGVVLTTPTTGDNCSVASVTNNAPVSFPLGSTTVIWTVTDGSGRTATATQTVTVTDNVNPTITAPANVATTTNTACTATGVTLGTPTTTDNCSVASVFNNAPVAFALGVTTVIWTVTDGSGNTTNANQTVTVTDNVNPTITAPANVNANTNTACTATGVALGTPITADNCSVASVTNNAPVAFPLGSTTVIWTVTDGSGNTATANQTVTVTDNVNPTITAPANVNANTNTACTATGVALGTPTTADNCSVASVTNNAPVAFPLGNTTVTWTITDGSGRTATATQIVTITDNVNPTINAPANVTTTTNTACTATGVALGTPTTSDNCSVVSVTNNAPVAFPLGNTTVTWTITDGSGRTATATQVVTVNDTVNPSIVCPANLTTNVGIATCTASVVSTNPTTADNCAVTKLTWNLTGATTGTSAATGINNLGTRVFNLGVTTVSYRVEDPTGNFATCSYTVTIIDNITPTINSITNISTTVAAGTCFKSVTTTNPTTSDNCTVAKLTWTMNGATIASSPLTGINTIGTYTFNLGVTTITYSVFDGAGNTTNTVYTITITDNIAPTIICPSNLTLNVGTGTCSASAITTNPTTADNCAVTKLTWNLTGATSGVSAATGINNLGSRVFNLGLTTVSYRVEDTAGNFATCSYTVRVIDNELPSITSLPAISANCSVTISVPPTSPDNCGTITGITGDITLPYTFSTPGFYIVGWNFTDASGNSKNISQTITVIDNTAPVPSAASLPNLNFTACELLSSQLTFPTALDACNGTITGVPSILFPYSVLGASVITWTYTDATGNVSSQNQNINMTSEVIDGGTLKGYLTSAGATTAATVVNITSCNSGGNEIKINLSGQIGTIVQWEKYEVGDAIWVSIPNTTNNYTVTFYPATTESTFFRALIKVNSCYQYSSSFYVRALPADKPPILVQSLFNICLNENVTLVARRGYTIQEDALAGKGGDFNTGQFPDKFNDDMWRIDGKPSASHWTANGNATKDTNWAGTNPHPFGTITYDSGDPKFGIAQGNYYSSWIQQKQPQVYTTVSTLETPIFSLKNMTSASLNFDQAYNLVSGDYIKLQLSIDGGVTYPITLQSFVGPKTWDWATHPGSTATQYNFQNDNSSFDLTPYVGQLEVRARWTFHGTSDKSVWAIDGITIPIVPKLDAIEWTDGIGNPGVPPIANGVLESSFTYTPEAPGKHQYGATVLVDGCRSYDASGTAMADVNVSYSYAGSNITLGPEVCGSNTVKLNAYDNAKTANQNQAKGSYTIPTGCTTCNDPGTGQLGTWSITGTSSCGTGTFSNINDPDATFTGEVGSYVLTWIVKGCSSTVNVVISNCSTVDFDGTNDYIDFKKQNYDLNSNFSIEVWVKTAVSSSNIQTIFSKRNGNVLGNGYDLRVQNDFVTFRWNGTGSLTSPHKIGSNRWYHIAVTYANSEYKLYIDGILMGTKNGSSLPIVNNYKSFLGAMDQDNNAPNNPINYFKGWIDEFKIWNVALTDEQIRQMMNQEIKEQITGNNVVYGEIIPMPIYGLTWSNLKGYYRMNQFGCGYLKPSFGVGVEGKLKNITSAEPQTAPLPYYSIIGGNWTDTTSTTPWAYGNSVWDYPNSIGINGASIDWNIVRSLHNINSTPKDITLLGLRAESGKLTIANPSQPLDEKNNGQGLWITHYLKLDGNIDLVGESQLVQKGYTTNQVSESIFDPASTGFIKRDQQGKKNSFNYNYWSSPVSTIQGSLNNMPYKIKDVIKDGTSSANPKTINFDAGAYFADATLSNPIKTSDRWIWSYNSQIVQGDEWANYYQWSHITSQGTIKVGEAFTMKGTGGVSPILDTQNYSFIGKPNSGTITLNLIQNNSYLVGNPYPSALDADEFIKDNLKDCLGCRSTVNSFSGALYFWDHFGLSNNHTLAEYEGGYATYTLMGGVAAINNSPLNLNDGAIGSNIPKRYIPVAQGFFIDGFVDSEVTGAQIPTVVQGGPILFKNNQRVFQRESTPSSVFMKKRETTKTNTDSRQKIRLGFESAIGGHRQILVGVDNNSTNQFDIGYDAAMFDVNENDMYWEINKNKFVIQAIPNFNTDQTIPLGIVNKNEGEVKIKIDKLENISSNTTIYLYDNESEIYHDLRNSEFKTTLAIGEFNKRFSLKFNKNQTPSLDVKENNANDDIIVYYSNKTLFIKNKEQETTVNKVSLYNILGQAIENQKTENQEQQNIQVPIKNISTGIYIAKLKTAEGFEISKKVVVFDD